MFRVASIWIKNPLTSWNEIDAKEYSLMQNSSFDSVESVIESLCELKAFSFDSVEQLNLIYFNSYCDIFNYEFEVKETYQIKHKDFNQCPFEVRLTLVKDND